MKTRIDSPQRDRMALLPFAIIGTMGTGSGHGGAGRPDLALRHPLTGEPVQFWFSTFGALVPPPQPLPALHEGLPAAGMMTDNGAVMVAEETANGLDMLWGAA